MRDLRKTLESHLGDRYAVIRELGSGGMATVFLATDTKHGRPVALKVLRPDVAAAIGAERFLREIETVARLTHPHILPLHDSGEASGVLYYVTPYIEGESLRDRLEREGALPVDDALSIARECADGLAYAHDQGVLHRDVKPGNVLLSGGHAVLADFGVARALEEAAEAESLTGSGVSLGTVGYMSPEQAAAEDKLNARSDIYALGCVLYEMLAGEPAFRGPTARAVMARQMEGPPSVTTVRSTVPPSLETVIEKACRATPADRFASAAEMAAALDDVRVQVATGSPSQPGRDRRVVAFGIVMAALVALAGVWWVAQSGASAGGGDGGTSLRSVAVLPFSNLSADPDNRYFSDGLAEEIRNVLANVDGLDVAARTSSVAYRDRDTDVREIGSELGVGAVLEGSVQRAGDRVRVTAQLIQTSDGFHLWSEAYDRELDDIFRIQEEVAQQIVRAMRVELDVPVERAVARRRPTDDMEAYQLFLQARHLYHQRTGEALLRSVDLYRDAIERDSTFAEAYGGLAMAYIALPTYGTPELEYDPVERARAMAERGLELDSTLAQGYAVRGHLLFLSRPSPDLPNARLAFDRARELDPDDATVALFTALTELTAGRLGAADTILQRALELDPAMAGIITFYMGWLADLQGDTDRALRLHQRAHDMGYPWARSFVCITAAIAHQYQEVREPWCDPAEVDDSWIHDLDSIMNQGPAENREYLETRQWRALWLGPSLDLPDPFFSALEGSFYATHIWSYVWHPTVAPYRRDPRFTDWVRRMQLPEYWDATGWPDFCARTDDREIRCH